MTQFYLFLISVFDRAILIKGLLTTLSRLESVFLEAMRKHSHLLTAHLAFGIYLAILYNPNKSDKRFEHLIQNNLHSYLTKNIILVNLSLL